MFGGKLLVYDRQGSTTVEGHYVSVARETLISTGDRDDNITFTDSVFRRAAVIGTRGGADRIDLSRSTFRGSRDVFAGAGNNTVIGIDDEQ